MSLHTPQCIGQSPTTKNFLAWNVNSVQAEKSCFKGTSLGHTGIPANNGVTNIPNMQIIREQTFLAESKYNP